MPGILAIVSALLFQQAPTVAMSPDTAYVGDVVSLAFRVNAPAGAALVIPDTLAVSGNVENAARARIRTDTLPDRSLRFTVYYSVVGWRPGAMPLPPVEGVVRGPAGDTPFTVQPPDLTIASVLPPDTAGIEPKPLKDVIGPTRVWWLAALAVLAGLILLALLVWWWLRRRRRTRETNAAAPPVPPRELFLRELDEISQGPLRHGDMRAFYIRASAALRQYVASFDPDWGQDLTTMELSPRMRDAELAPVLSVLERADLVKFARRPATQEEAQRDLRELRRWAETYGRPQQQPQMVEAA